MTIYAEPECQWDKYVPTKFDAFMEAVPTLVVIGLILFISWLAIHLV